MPGWYLASLVSSHLCTRPCPRLQGPFELRRRDLVHGNLWQSRSGIRHDGNALYQRYQRDTKRPNKDYTGPHRANEVPLKRPLVLTFTPHALKLPGQAHPAIWSANHAHEGQRRAAPQIRSRRRYGRQGRAGDAPLCGKGALTALRRREIGSACTPRIIMRHQWWRILSCQVNPRRRNCASVARPAA
jgi:hypothetical protein